MLLSYFYIQIYRTNKYYCTHLSQVLGRFWHGHFSPVVCISAFVKTVEGCCRSRGWMLRVTRKENCFYCRCNDRNDSEMRKLVVIIRTIDSPTGSNYWLNFKFIDFLALYLTVFDDHFMKNNHIYLFLKQ